MRKFGLGRPYSLERGKSNTTLAAVLCYLLYVSPVDGQRVARAADVLPPDLQEEIMTGVEQFYERGRQQGLARGLQRGREEGREEGERLALATTLLRLARLRFGALPGPAIARVDAAGTPELERWLEALLSAERLDDLFA